MAKPKPVMQQGDYIMRLQDVINKTGLSKSSIYRLSGDPDSDFPASIKLSEKTVGWYESSITGWMESRKVAA